MPAARRRDRFQEKEQMQCGQGVEQCVIKSHPALIGLFDEVTQRIPQSGGLESQSVPPVSQTTLMSRHGNSQNRRQPRPADLSIVGTAIKTNKERLQR
ncbi:hypothetical protein AAFF_G00316990 [Aldrovandia affinis]|uniref:Uncharacterized protein n=1 Tax=Aldrovandia affinis TaxID=143900 RepID=A0AAD7R7H8_9TELE|nr:hypothetical protein AAFF_G00316990 [Aldrovandia affinis]